mgnify:CR=1 FL=1
MQNDTHLRYDNPNSTENKESWSGNYENEISSVSRERELIYLSTTVLPEIMIEKYFSRASCPTKSS